MQVKNLIFYRFISAWMLFHVIITLLKLLMCLLWTGFDEYASLTPSWLTPYFSVIQCDGQYSGTPDIWQGRSFTFRLRVWLNIIVQILQPLVASFTSLGTSALPDRFKIACRLNPAALYMIWLVTHLPYSSTTLIQCLLRQASRCCMRLAGWPSLCSSLHERWTFSVRQYVCRLYRTVRGAGQSSRSPHSFIPFGITSHGGHWTFCSCSRRHAVACPGRTGRYKRNYCRRSLMIYLLQLARVGVDTLEDLAYVRSALLPSTPDWAGSRP